MALLYNKYRGKMLLILTVFLFVFSSTPAQENKGTYFGAQYGHGSTFGNVLGFAFNMRKGFGSSGNFGIGGNAAIGFGLFEKATYFQYSAGVKLFPYKIIFLSGNFGALGVEKTATFNSNEQWGMAGPKKYHGPSFLGGVEFKLNGWLFTFGGGMSYYMGLDKWTPAWTIGIGW
jgi:hypothetical protein